jgi:hypothetical protein
MPYWERLESFSWIERRWLSLGVGIDFSSPSEDELSEIESSFKDGYEGIEEAEGAGGADGAEGTVDGSSLSAIEEFEELEDEGRDLASSWMSIGCSDEELDELEGLSGTSSIGEIYYF